MKEVDKLEIGLIGLGKMGYNLGLNLTEKNYKVHAFDVDENMVKKLENTGIKPFNTLEELVYSLQKPCVIWLMVPSGETTDKVINSIVPYLQQDDVLIDGGNSNYKDTVRRNKNLKQHNIHFLDVGTSGGKDGARNGACTMIGGEKEIFERVRHLFEDISTKDGYLYTGKSGSGHYLKMVHNAIEYGMMQSIAEGFELLYKSEYEYDFEKVSKVWNNGSVIRSWLMELTESAFMENKHLEGIKGVMHSSGEGKWAAETALDLKVPTPVLTLSLIMRYRSLEENTFSGKVVASLRNKFGGHHVEKE